MMFIKMIKMMHQMLFLGEKIAKLKQCSCFHESIAKILWCIKSRLFCNVEINIIKLF